MSDDIDDFGFTAMNEDDLKAVQSPSEIEELQNQLDVVDKRATKLYNAIIPLLDNLRKNPEKEYILWPDRASKIDAFETKLSNILNGEDN